MKRILVMMVVCALAGSARADETLPAPRSVEPRSVEPAAPVVDVPGRTSQLLHAGEKATLRIRDVIPHDGLSPGERLLNGKPALQPGDRFLAESLGNGMIVGGQVANVENPGWFGKPGRVTLELVQLVQTVDGRQEPIPWQLLADDRRFTTLCRRRLLTTLFALEGAGVGAAVGAQLAQGSIAFIGGGAGVGLIVGLGYASLQRGGEACLEPGTTFEVVVGTMSYRPSPLPPPTPLFPAGDPSRQGSKR